MQDEPDLEAGNRQRELYSGFPRVREGGLDFELVCVADGPGFVVLIVVADRCCAGHSVGRGALLEFDTHLSCGDPLLLPCGLEVVDFCAVSVRDDEDSPAFRPRASRAPPEIGLAPDAAGRSASLAVLA
jgi:hypothetical protein